MPEVIINIDIYCAKCGAGLCNQTTFSGSRRSGIYSHEPSFSVEPCDNCLKQEYDKGYDDGYEKGYQYGLREGQERGEV